MKQQTSITGEARSIATVDQAVLLQIVTDGAADIAVALQELETADKLGSQASIYADRAADKVRVLLDHAPAASHTREALKEIQALILAAGVNAQMTVYRMRDAGTQLKSTTGKPE